MEEHLQKKVADMLEFYDELGLGEFYLRRPSPPKATAISAESAAGDTRIGMPMEQPVFETGFPRPDSPFGQTPPNSRSNSAAVLQTAVAPGPGPQVLSLFDSPSPARAARKDETLEMIREDLGDCHRCRLAAGRHTIVFGQGNPHAELVFVGEGPGADEDAQGLPFVGRAGQLLNRMIQFIGMKREEVYICNVVKCRPPGNRTPLPDEIEMCSPFLLRQIAVIRPRLVCCLGAPAVRTLLGIKEGITKIRGRFYDFQGTQALATFHPAYILRNPREEKVLREDFQKIAEFLKMPR
jgi:uracil-DNA glycosylase family 4